jgi:hypothetical protein
MSAPTFACKFEIAPTATCNSCRGSLLDVCINKLPNVKLRVLSLTRFPDYILDMRP